MSGLAVLIVLSFLYRHPTAMLCVLWLGSSVGNLKPHEAVGFFQNMQQSAGANIQVPLSSVHKSATCPQSSSVIQSSTTCSLVSIMKSMDGVDIWVPACVCVLVPDILLSLHGFICRTTCTYMLRTTTCRMQLHVTCNYMSHALHAPCSCRCTFNAT